MSYIIEKSNEKHPGIVILQDGKLAKDVLPIFNFVDICNRSKDLLDSSLPFLSFVFMAFTTKKEFNNYLNLVTDLDKQCGDFFLQIKQKGLPIAFLDPDYWNSEYERITNAIDTGILDKIQAAKELAFSFKKAMLYCIEKNITTAQPYGIQPPLSQFAIK